MKIFLNLNILNLFHLNSFQGHREKLRQQIE